MPTSPELENYVENAMERQSTTELVAEDNRSETIDFYNKLLQDVSLRSPDVWDWFIEAHAKDEAEDRGLENAAQLIIDLSLLVNRPFDDFESIPVPERTSLWNLAEKIFSASAHRQAVIMSGATKEAFIDGANNAQDLRDATDNLTKKELKNVSVELNKTMAQKKEQKRNGN